MPWFKQLERFFESSQSDGRVAIASALRWVRNMRNHQKWAWKEGGEIVRHQGISLWCPAFSVEGIPPHLTSAG